MPVIGYTRPGSYVQRVKNVSVSSDTVSTSVAGFVGEVKRGVAGKAITVTSWKEFTETFTLGYANPFQEGELADAVFGFFNNGGTQAVIVRALGKEAKKAKVTIGESLVIEAKEEGSFGNDIDVEVEVKEEVAKLIVNVLGTQVETLSKIKVAEFASYVNANSKFVNVVSGEAVKGNGTLIGGSNGELTVGDYKEALECLDVADVNVIAIPGVTTLGVQEAVVEYATKRGNVFPVLSAPAMATVEEIKDFKDKMPGFCGAIYYPRILIADQFTGEPKYVSPVGHMIGVYARTDAERGVHKAPAGVEAYVAGAIGVEKVLTETEVGILNDYEINCILPKKGYGIVAWGARLLNTDGDRQFVSDLRLDMYVEETIKRNTEWAVFEPKDDQLFNRLQAQLTSELTTMWRAGMLLGNSPEEAFYVKCDSELNPDILSSTLEIEVGYAKKKPAEFIVTRVSHKQASAE